MTGDGPGMLRFDDGKDARAMRTIGEVAAALGIKQHVLRYWEQQFPMLQPLKRSGGRRYYRPEDVVLVQTIDRLVNDEGYTLKGACHAIESGSSGAGASAQVPAPPESLSMDAEILARLKAIRGRLAQALDAA